MPFLAWRLLSRSGKTGAERGTRSGKTGAGPWPTRSGKTGAGGGPFRSARRGKTLAGLRGGDAWRRRCDRNAVVRGEKLPPTVGAHVRLQVIGDGLKVPVPRGDHCSVQKVVHCARCHRIRRGLREEGIHWKYGDSKDP